MEERIWGGMGLWNADQGRKKGVGEADQGRGVNENTIQGRKSGVVVQRGERSK